MSKKNCKHVFIPIDHIGIDIRCMRCGKQIDFFEYYRYEIAPILRRIKNGVLNEL